MPSLQTYHPTDLIENKRKQYIVVGVGNLLQRDDGVGVHAVRALHSFLQAYSNVSCIDAGTLSYELLEWVANSDHTIDIDAAHMRSAPGTVKVFENDEIAQQFTHATAHSVHQITLHDTLLTSQALYSKPTEVTLIGVEPDAIEWGTSLSPQVSLALPSIMDNVFACLSKNGLQACGPTLKQEAV